MYYYDKEGKLTQAPAALPLPGEDDPVAERERKIQLAQQGLASQEVTGFKERDLRAAIQQSQAETAQNVAQTQANAQIEAARLRARGGYAAGGAVKNDHPFNKSFDNKLLMKGRR